MSQELTDNDKICHVIRAAIGFPGPIWVSLRGGKQRIRTRITNPDITPPIELALHGLGEDGPVDIGVSWGFLSELDSEILSVKCISLKMVSV